MPMTMPVLLLLATLLPAAGDSAAEPPPRARGGILVSATSSLEPAFRALGAAFAAAHPGRSVTFSFAASDVIRARIESGVLADVFALDGESEMTPLVQRRLVDSTSVRVFATNRVVLCAPAGGRLTHLKQLESGFIRRVAIGNPGSVPAGRLAVQALSRAGAWRAVRLKAMYGESVRRVLQYVETSVVDAGVVYLTDARDNPKVRIVGENDSPWLDREACPAGVTAGTAEPALAREFVDFLRSDRAREILKAAGFGAP